MFLKPFTYPVPETRFLHAGRSVYKLKIRYGNFLSCNDIDNNETTTKELEEAIRVIIGNLDNLHPFATERLTIFPYLSKWERVSKLRFKHGDTFLAPYPHVCTMYVELNSFQQNIFVVPNSPVVDAVNQKNKHQYPHSTPANKDSKCLDLLGCKVYSSSTLQFQIANYMAVLAKYDHKNYNKFMDFIEDISEAKKPQFTALISEEQILSHTALQAALDVANTAARSTITAVVMC
ncbi:uncharacterized protein [Lepidochelys kempii]|uniref:uncharacterized protein n=1 Tax=Lepidochelys kempii TaxID=8472 RepID=UPI003C6F1101